MNNEKPDGWLRFEAKVKISRVYVACWSRPVSNAPLRTRLSYVFAYFSLITAIIFSSSFFSPYLPLDELAKIEAVIIKSYTSHTRRSGYENWLEFRTVKDDIKKYELASATEKDTNVLDKYRGEKAKIWIQYRYGHVNSYHVIWQIKIGGNVVVDYRYDSDAEIKEANDKIFETTLFIVLIGGGGFILLMFYVVFRLGKAANN